MAANPLIQRLQQSTQAGKGIVLPSQGGQTAQQIRDERSSVNTGQILFGVAAIVLVGIAAYGAAKHFKWMDD